MHQADSPIADQNLRHNFLVNIMDGAFFGLGLGLASYVTIIPLFLATLTDSTLLIGLVATVHTIGWQLPQVLTAARVSRLPLYRPMVLYMTFHERWPFLGLALVALLVGSLSPDLALVLIILMVVWQSFGGGFTATAWQSMISKIVPIRTRGTFFGLQSAAANLMMSIGAIVAGLLLGLLPSPYNFAACFFFAAVSMGVSFAFLTATREKVREATAIESGVRVRSDFWQTSWRLLRSDANFRYFILARMLSQIAQMALAFFTIYATRQFEMTPEVAGVLTGIFGLTQTITAPIAGSLGDRFGHRVVLMFGNMIMALSAALAVWAPELNWFYLVFALAGVVNGVQWTSIIAITVEFGDDTDRPFYIGLSNTLTAPVTLLGPVLGGWLADTVGFGATFSVSVVGGVLATVVLLIFMHDPIPRRKTRRARYATGD